jgi:hypothetical protein
MGLKKRQPIKRVRILPLRRQVDIVGILKKSGIGTIEDLKAWLGGFPKS